MIFLLKYWKFIAAGLVIVAIYFMVQAYNSAIEDAAIWESKYLTEKASREARDRANAALQGELDQLVIEKAKIRADQVVMVKKIKELEDEAGREWLDAPVPESVVDLLLQGNPGGAAVLPNPTSN